MQGIHCHITHNLKEERRFLVRWDGNPMLTCTTAVFSCGDIHFSCFVSGHSTIPADFMK